MLQFRLYQLEYLKKYDEKIIYTDEWLSDE